ncbi:MAG TPA: DUF4350 domain-containing protein [Lapillicoccus sp.]|nr:DUF4350 domain-containing protein [Lapillicoccus sp.]
MSTELWERAPEAAQTHTESGNAAEPRRRRPWRRRWVLVAVLAAAVVAVAVLFVSQGPGPASSAPLDPRNPTANGAQALARVLESQGIRVDIARGQAELERAGADGDTTVFVARTGALASSTTQDLVDIAAEAERLVLVAPNRSVLQYVAPDVGVTDARRTEQDLVATDCGTTDVRAGETLSRSHVEYSSTLADAACFTHDGHSVYLAIARHGGVPPTVLLGSTSMLANDQITDASNAAIMLRTLGHSGRVVWYVPSREDVPSGDTGLDALLPLWLGPVLALGAVAFLGVILWRGRRFGRLVPEPLPVVVRAVETTESRGRLYRRARDASRAGATLQQATRSRLADYLGLPRPTPALPSPGADQALVSAVAAASGRRIDEVGALLLGPPPTRDDHLLGLAAELAALEKEVRRS